MLRRGLVLGTGLLALLPALAHGKDPETLKFRVTALPGVNPGVGLVFVSDMNDRGEVVGGSIKEFSGSLDDIRIRPCFWDEDGVLSELPVFSVDGLNSGARGINDRGLVVGECGFEDGNPFSAHAVAWDDGEPTDLGVLPGDGFASANDVNKHGVIVGSSVPDPFFFGGGVAVRWIDGEIESLGGLPGDFESEARSINKRGTIVGVSGDFFGVFDGLVTAVTWDEDGDIHVLPRRALDNWSAASDVNDDGVVVGSAGTFTDPEPFFSSFLAFTDPVRWVKGKMETLPVLPGDTAGRAIAVNNHGTIVGESILADEFGFPIESHPVIWIDGKVVDLNSVDTGADDWTLTFVTAVNDHGEVAGTGFLDGVELAFRATPVRGR